jgi:hypothetical protein
LVAQAVDPAASMASGTTSNTLRMADILLMRPMTNYL